MLRIEVTKIVYFYNYKVYIGFNNECPSWDKEQDY